ncbi:hypothetical protein KVR01_002532 [Diaporthe batatas]|uniref:uncharacterized protein n=1 Tax=Diaporthe batatas TaxID=748121 RepID=UPI001D043BF2|nr:uncharacterized protein KVR01_002532 [Diaporthe batatas]KAG8166843.1 hypothetical protein KVR01_002532 [Diaporthe batatas]
MASASPLYMPGTFHCSEPTTPAATTLNANMFRPPASPTTSSNHNLSGSMLSDNTSANNGMPAPRLGRKRTYDETRASSSYFDKVSGMEDSARGQDRYLLAGQIETPGTQATPGSAAGLDDSLYSDVDYRRRLELGSKTPHDDPPPILGLYRTIPLILAPATPTSPRAAGWTTFAFQAIGGVVGKVWEFCRGGAGAFQGFRAGGGKAYETNGQPINSHPQLQIQTDLPPTPQDREDSESPPGAFPVFSDAVSYLPDSIPDYEDHRQEEIYRDYQEQEEQEQQRIHQQQQEQQREHERQEMERQELERQEQLLREGSPDTISDRPAPKRRQTGMIGELDELRRNWVMVDEKEQQQSPTTRRPALNKRTSISSISSITPSRIPARTTSNLAARLQQPNPFATPTKQAGSMDPPARRFSVTSTRFGFEQKPGIQPPRSASRLSLASNASYAGGSVASPSLGSGDGASFASPRSPPSRSTPTTPTVALNGSRIPQPKGLGLNLGGPNPFANIQRPSPNNNNTPSSRPTSRHSARHSVHHSPLTPSFIPRSGTPSRAGGHHRRSATSLSAGRARSPSGAGGAGGTMDPQLSPRLDDEAKRLAAQRAAAEKRNTTRLDRLNGELQALIRQGQAALDTEFDVQMGDADDGWDDYGN